MDATVRGADYAFRRGMEGTQAVSQAEGAARAADNAAAAAGRDDAAVPSVSADALGESQRDAGGAAEEDTVRDLEPAGAQQQQQQQQGKGWTLSNVFLTGIKSMGRAVKLTGKVATRVNEEATEALGRHVRVRCPACLHV